MLLYTMDEDTITNTMDEVPNILLYYHTLGPIHCSSGAGPRTCLMRRVFRKRVATGGANPGAPCLSSTLW